MRENLVSLWTSGSAPFTAKTSSFLPCKNLSKWIYQRMLVFQHPRQTFSNFFGFHSVDSLRLKSWDAKVSTARDTLIYIPFPFICWKSSFPIEYPSPSHSIRRRLHSAILFKFIGNINNDSFLSVCLLLSFFLLVIWIIFWFFVFSIESEIEMFAGVG